MFSNKNCHALIQSTLGDNKRVYIGCGDVKLENIDNNNIFMVVNIANRIFTRDRVTISDDYNCIITKEPPGRTIICGQHFINGVLQQQPKPEGIAVVKIDGKIWCGNMIEIKRNEKSNAYDLIIDGVKQQELASDNFSTKNTMSQVAIPRTNTIGQHLHIPDRTVTGTLVEFDQQSPIIPSNTTINTAVTINQQYTGMKFFGSADDLIKMMPEKQEQGSNNRFKKN